MRSRLTTALTAGAILGTAGAASPVGSYRLTTVDGVRVPMLWKESTAAEGGAVQLHWISGRAEFRRDGHFEVTVTAMRTGIGLAGTPEPMSIRGTWRMRPGSRVELRFGDGVTSTWGPADLYSRLTVKTRYPDLEGQYRAATMVLVRN